MDNMLDLINSLKDVPAMPNVIKHALDVVKDPESGAKELARIISYDQSLSTKILTLVNSAYYGFSQQINSISRGISLIGMSKAKNVILTVAMKPMLINQGDRELWKHSIITAVGCEHVAKYYKIMDPDEAFVMGFLHDLGKIILSMKDSKLYEYIKQTTQPGSNILEVEKVYYGADHCQMGSILAKRWQLPLMVSNVIKYHHNPKESSMPMPCILVYFVDALVQSEEHFESLDKTLLQSIKIHIDQPQILRENIISKAEILLNELSS